MGWRWGLVNVEMFCIRILDYIRKHFAVHTRFGNSTQRSQLLKTAPDRNLYAFLTNPSTPPSNSPTSYSFGYLSSKSRSSALCARNAGVSSA